MDRMLQTLKEGLPVLGLELPDETAETLCRFGQAVVKQNEVMNLTAITEPDQVAKLHLLDSLSVLKCADLKGKTLIAFFYGCFYTGEFNLDEPVTEAMLRRHHFTGYKPLVEMIAKLNGNDA